MQGKYPNSRMYAAAWLKRAPIRIALRTVLRWRPLDSPADGYTVLIGVNHGLVPMLGANLRMLDRQRREHLHQVIVVVNRTRESIDGDRIERDLRARFPNLPLRVVFFTPWQQRVSTLIGWAWVYSWLSWSIGIALTQTRHAILHDFDAMLIRDDVLEQRYRTILERGDEFLGVRYYHGNGVIEDDRLVTTFELMFDAAFVRRTFRPIDLFNQLAVRDGRSVDYDTFLYAQSLAGRGSVDPIEKADMVHPSQMICQFVELTERSKMLAPTTSNLLLVPYYLHVAGDTDTLDRFAAAMEAADGDALAYFGKSIATRSLTPEHAAWMRKQAEVVERSLGGEVCPSVSRYFDAVDRAMVRRV